MIHDEDVAALVRDSIPEDQLRSVDPDKIAAAAARRYRRRRWTALVGATIATVAIASGGVLAQSMRSPDATVAPSSTPSKDALAPRDPESCNGLPAIDIVGAPSAGLYSVSARAATAVVINAVVPAQDVALLDGALVVGIPGATTGRSIDVGATSPNPLPPTDIGRPENQLVRQSLRQGEPATLQFTAAKPGDYPVFYSWESRGPARCNAQSGAETQSGTGIIAIIRIT